MVRHVGKRTKQRRRKLTLFKESRYLELDLERERQKENTHMQSRNIYKQIKKK